MSREKQIDEMARTLKEYTVKENIMASYIILEKYAEHLYNAGYRKESDVVAEVLAKVKEWLYEITINNIGCEFEGDFSKACEEIISRLDGLERFIKGE